MKLFDMVKFKDKDKEMIGTIVYLYRDGIQIELEVENIGLFTKLKSEVDKI